MPNQHWKDAQNCRQFFDHFAYEAGFDPSDVSAWYAANLKVLTKKVKQPFLVAILT